MRLTDITIKSLQPPSKGARIYTDDIVPGFGVRVSEGGTKSFVLTHGPRHQRETIGRVGIVGLQEARNDAKRRLAEYTLGKDKPRTVSWDTAREEFLAEKLRKLKPRTHADYTYILNRHFKYGTTKLSEITPYDLRQNLDRLGKRPPNSCMHTWFCARSSAGRTANTIATAIRWSGCRLDIDTARAIASSRTKNLNASGSLLGTTPSARS